MSRKGKQPIPLPSGVEVTIQDQVVVVKGPKGSLQKPIVRGTTVRREGNELHIEIDENVDDAGKFHGLMRALVANMVTGVSKGFEKQLELIGVGYRATVQGKDIDLQLGFSHPTKMPIPEGISVKVDKNIVTISGTDKQFVGEYCAQLRAVRPPEPYQGKGVRYKDEYVRRKQGKAAGKK